MGSYFSKPSDDGPEENPAPNVRLTVEVVVDKEAEEALFQDEFQPVLTSSPVKRKARSADAGYASHEVAK
jgi:hypothetical protein